ncbi:MAG: MATE family efflux transporter [Bacteroidetes bacterium]|nr:MATE family efflux transporter [Bacteroidota bacterium]
MSVYFSVSPLNKRILALAIPNVVTNIAIPLLGMVDMGLMGHLGSAVYIGAIAVGTTIFNFIFWSFGFLRMGTSGFTAQAYGRRNLEESMMTLYRALFLGFSAGLMLILLQMPIDWLAFSLIHGSKEVETLARQYFYIRIYAAPPTLCLYAFTGWYIGMQNARIPMTVSISVNILNILFSLCFIFLLGMKTRGIALANVFSQYAGIFLATAFFLIYYRKLLKYKPILKLGTRNFWKFLSVNKDIFIRTLCLIFVGSFFTAKSASSGDAILAVNSLLFQLFYFFSYFIDGFAYAAEALVGKYKGAGNSFQLVRVIRRLFFWGMIISLVFTIIYSLAGHWVLSLLTNNLIVLTDAGPYLFWLGLVPLITFSAFLWDGIYVGATASRAMRNSMIVAAFLVFLPAWYLFKGILGNHGLWLAMMLFMGTRGVLLTWFSKRAVLQ